MTQLSKLLASESNWCQKAFARDQYGEEVLLGQSDVSWSLKAAIYKLEPEKEEGWGVKIEDAFLEKFGDRLNRDEHGNIHEGVADYFDSLNDKITYAELIATLKELGE